ncbi:MAG: formylglycine-generating enzyme family protein [Candidatus Eisenbacteria bacterium]
MRAVGVRWLCLMLVLSMFAAGCAGRPAAGRMPAEGPTATITARDGAEMVLIPAGDYLMGSPDRHGHNDERPQHMVHISAFYIDRYEVTNALYKRFLDETGNSRPPFWNDPKYNGPDQPVTGVTFYDAEAYARWAGKRLPTEAEWEKAARGGLAGKRYAWGDDLPDAGGTHRANYDTGKRAGSDADGYAYPAPVGSYPPNGYGLSDMAGNVWEWCSDRYGSDYYGESAESDPRGPEAGATQVLRGGSWFGGPEYLRASTRYHLSATTAYDNVGFRCAQNVS